jgi:isoquinoline 1-oxidoreductase beta subunit
MVMSRRTFVQLAALGSGALVLGVRLGDAVGEEAAEFHPNAWLRIDADGRIVLVVGKTEMGQGVRTSLPMILAEELDADFTQETLEQASPGPEFQGLGTGGSSSVMGSWDALRQAGAAAREMLVAAAAARWGVDPEQCRTENARVIEGSSGRSLGYGELAAEAARQKVPRTPRLKSIDSFRLVGTPQKHLDGSRMVTGRARYGLDVKLPGMLVATLERAPVLGGTVQSFDASAALQVPGVHRCVEISNGVAVVADATWAALKGREALKVEWNESPHAHFSSAAHMQELEAAAAGGGITTRRDGAGLAAFEDVADRFEATYSYPFEAHASIEPVNSTVWLHDDRCEVWTPTQTPNAVQAYVARALGLPIQQVTVHVTLVGGGFGRRLGWDFDVEAAEIARAVEAPVQLLWTRHDDMRQGYFQAAAVHALRAGMDGTGKVVAWGHCKASTPHNARRRPTPQQLQDPDTLLSWSWGVYDTPYAIPALETSYAVVDAPVPIGPWRAVFSPSSVFARECFVDELSLHLERNPLDFRLELLGANDPGIPDVITPGGDHVERSRLRRVLEVATSKAGWGAPLPTGRARGLACNVFHTGTYIAYVVEVSRHDGALPFAVERVVCAVDCGVVVNPLGVRQQVDSGIIWSLSNMKTQITFREGAAVQWNYRDYPVATIDEAPPRIETFLVDDSGDERPHGLGEPVVCPFAPAVVNALHRLTGKRIRHLPVTAADLG